MKHKERWEKIERFQRKEYMLLDGLLEKEAGKPGLLIEDRKNKKNVVYESGNFMKPGERISVFIQSAGEKVEDHKHDYIELNYVWKGSFSQVIEGNKVVSLEGDVCIFDTKAVHSVEYLEKDAILVNILMRKEFFDSAFLTRISGQGLVSEFLVEAVLRNRKKKHYLFFPSHENPKVSLVMEHILWEYFEKDIGFEEVMASDMVILFTQLLRTRKNRREEEDASSEEKTVLDILTYIERCNGDCNLTRIAQEFGFHPNYLSALLKKKTGSSFLEHVQNQKLGRARAYLRNTDMAVTQIAELCGYHNVHFFYQLFEKEEGCTPGEYRSKSKDL